MTSIIGGEFKGRKLRVPQSVTRPTSSRVREALFSSIEHALGDFDDVHVLDLFAGSGALGLEAISRGALDCVFVEKDKRAADVVKSNISDLGVAGKLVNDDVMRETSKPTAYGQFDLVFLDPPYALTDEQVTECLNGLVVNKWLNDGALVVVERSSKSSMIWPDGMEQTNQRAYGDTGIWYGQYISD